MKKFNFTVRLSKVEIVSLFILLLLLGTWALPNVTNYNDKVIQLVSEDNTILQKMVDNYYYENIQFPSRFQPSIGFPTKINMNLINRYNLPNYSIDKNYLVDAYGKVYILNDGFHPPKNLEIVTTSKGETYLRWNEVDNAVGYGIREITNSNTALMNKAFGKVTASLLNVTSKGKVVVEQSKDKFETNGVNTLIYELKNYDRDAMYVIYAIDENMQETPEVTMGYIE